MRFDLSKMSFFSSRASFKLIDVNGENFINPFTLIDFLKNQGVLWNKEEALIVINEYDGIIRD
jgi:hypothetical protein